MRGNQGSVVSHVLEEPVGQMHVSRLDMKLLPDLLLIL